MGVHYTNLHKEILNDPKFLKKHKFLFEMKIYQDKLSSELTSKVHSHLLKLSILQEQKDFRCHGHSFFGLKNCLSNPNPCLSPSPNSKPINDVVSILEGLDENEKLKQKEEDLTEKIVFVYECELCAVFFCRNCVQNDPNNSPFYSIHHPHPLLWVDRDNRWRCDGRKAEGGCKSGNESFVSFGATRFRCTKCDYDLCENCLKSSRREEEKQGEVEEICIHIGSDDEL